MLFINCVFASPQEKILLVKDAHYSYIGVDNPNEVYGSYYEEALENNSFDYDVCIIPGKGDDGPKYDGSGDCQVSTSTIDSNGMQVYDIIIWFTGDDYGGEGGDTLTSTDQTELQTYLNNSGKLFITGQDIGSTIGATDFYEDYLHAIYCKDDEDDYDLIGETNDPVGDSLLIDISGSGGADNQESPSLIFYQEDGDIYENNSFYYSKTSSSGWCWAKTGSWYCVKCDDDNYIYSDSSFSLPGVIKADTGGSDGYKVAYFAFGFEGINNSDDRVKVMNRTINYLAGPKTEGTKFYARSLDNTSWEDLNITCDPLYSYCLRKMNPKVNATCINPQLFGNITGAEFFVNSTGEGNGTGMNATDGKFSEKKEIVNGNINVSGYSGIYIVNTHCNDSDNYWGKFDNYSFVVDTTQPLFDSPAISIKNDDDGKYINTNKPNIEIKTLSGKYKPDYMAFSCNNQNWTDWISYQQTYSNFNITDLDYGCNSTDGNRTIYVRIRDKAGNLGGKSAGNVDYPSDWIILDRKSPKINLIFPKVDAWLNSTNLTFVFNFTDEFSPEANCSLYLDRTLNQTNSSVSNNTNTNFSASNLLEGSHNWNITCEDLAGNFNSSGRGFSIDLTPPNTTDNSSVSEPWYGKNQIVELSCSDPNLADGSSGSACNSTYYCIANKSETCNPTKVYNNTTKVNITCEEGEICEKYINYYSVDNAGNNETVKNSSFIRIDKKPPEVQINSPSSEYVNKDTLVNTTITDNQTIDKAYYNLSNSTWSNSSDLSQSGSYWLGTLDTNSVSDGKYNLTIYANDSFGNLNNTKRVEIIIDNTPPNTKDNSSSKWTNKSQTIELNCSDDGIGCNTTLYCVDTSGTCTPDTTYNSTNKIEIGCEEGYVCKNYIRYRSNDSLGNLEDIETSSQIRIDKKAPQITIDNPKENETKSGIVSLETTITEDVGVNKSWYKIINTSDESQIFDEGNLSGDFDTTWNSTESISGKENITFLVSANDSLGKSEYNTSRNFTVDNTLPSVVIYYPKRIYLNQSFDLNLTAVATSGNNLSFVSYNITNSTGHTAANNSNATNHAEFSFTDFINISSWLDGKYNISFYANQTNGNNGTDLTWFSVDRVAPNTTDNTNSSWNSTWFKENKIVNLTCIDPNLSDGTSGSGCDKTLYCINNSNGSCTPNQNYQNHIEISCSKDNTCNKTVFYFSNDTVGNQENASKSNLILIDKQAPNTTDNSPSEWTNKSQTIELNCSDDGIGCNTTLYCVDTSGTCTPDTTYNSTNKIEIGCEEGYVCKNYIRYRSNDTLGNLEDKKTSNQIRIDKQVPNTTDNSSSKWTNRNQTVELTCSDEGSGCNSTYYCVANKSNNCSSFLKGDLVNITCEEGEICEKYISYYSLDNAGNNETVKNSSLIRIDKKPPEIRDCIINISEDQNFNDSRIYLGDSVNFSTNVTDLREVSKAIISVIKPSKSENISLSLKSGNQTNGTWTTSITPTEIGLYNITKVFANDSLGNLNETKINLSFKVVEPSIKIDFKENNEIDAGRNSSFNLTFNFNKTVSNQNLTLYIPDYYSNLTPWNCVNCTFSNPNVTVSQKNITGLKLNTSISAGTPDQDLNSTWNLEFLGENYSETTKIKTPLLNITNITCDRCNYFNETTCIVNQSRGFYLNFTIKNENLTNHTGEAYNVLFNLSSGIKEKSVSLGNLEPNSSNHTKINFNISDVGIYTLNIRVEEGTGNYTTTKSYKVKVEDIKLPDFLGRSWDPNLDNFISNINTSINKNFNKNETVEYFVKAKDNVGIENVFAEIVNNNNSTNKSLNLESQYTEFDIWKFTNKTDDLGTYDITKIYLNDTSGNLKEVNLTDFFEIIELNLSSSLSNQSIEINKTQTFYANISGNASSISKVEAKISKPDNSTETINFNFENETNNTYFYNGNYSNIDLSGNYSVNTTVILSSKINKTENLNFSVPYGNISINAEDRTLVENTIYDLPIFIVPNKGDLLNISVNISIKDKTIINSTNKTSDIGDILWKDNYQGKAVFFPINSTEVGNTTINITSYSPNLNESRIININVIPNDTIPPEINKFTYYNTTNLNEINKFVINTTETETAIKNVSVEVTWPSNITKNISATLNPNNLYEINFNGTNETGVYKLKVHSCDLADNCNTTTTERFNVTNEYETVTLTYNPYNKGDKINFNVSVKDVRNLSVEGFNLTLILNKDVKNVTLVNNTITNFGSYRIEPKDNPEADKEKADSTNYTIYVNVEKNGNEGEYNESFVVSEEIPTEIIYPETGYYPPNTGVDMNVSVVDMHSEVVKGAAVTAFCPHCTKDYARLTFDSETETYKGSSIFTAPNEDFGIFVYSSSYFGGNLGYTGRMFTTTKTTTEPSEGDGNGGGGNGGVPGITNCTCTEWKDKGCGLSNCSATEKYQTRVCNPAGCSAEKQCVYNPVCIPEKDFRISIDQEILEIDQGKTKKGSIKLENIGGAKLSLTISAEKECCDLNYTKSLELEKKEIKVLPILVHPNLSQGAGEYSIKFKVESEGVEKEENLRIVVKENPSISYLKSIKNKLPKLEEEIKKYKETGVDVTDLEIKIREIKTLIENSTLSIKTDNLDNLKKQTDEIKLKVGYIDNKLLTLKIKKFLLENKWSLILLVILTLIFSYLITQVIYPHFRLSREIRSLEEKKQGLVNSRKETEKKYFLRKINEKTFKDILVKTQQTIFEVRGKIRGKKENKESLLKEKLVPTTLLIWIISLPVSFFRYLKGLVTKLKHKFGKIKLKDKVRDIKRKKLKIKQIISDPKFVNREVTLKGEVSFIQKTSKEEFIYKIRDETGDIYIFSNKEIKEGENTITGVLHKSMIGQMYVEIKV